ncbi:MAG: hypothetical protein HY774_28615 [Acidobacteria bacterium]|nr:hypothetical protein [Acidobacteriota bacterium]
MKQVLEKMVEGCRRQLRRLPSSEFPNHPEGIRHGEIFQWQWRCYCS